MSKRLIIILALAFVVGIAFTAYAEVQNVKVSGDITVYGVGRNLTLKDTKSGGNSVDQSLIGIARVRVDADLTDNVSATVRLLNERYWGNEIDNSGSNVADGTDAQTNTEIALDLAYVTMKEFLYSPLTLTVGRQELHFGNDMIVGDPDTNNTASTASPLGSATAIRRDPDLSARKAFDAIRATLNYDPLVVDVIGAKVREHAINLHDDTNLYGVNANYALTKNTTIEGYWFEKKTGQKTSGVSNKNDRVDTLGARLATSPIKDLTFQLEAAYQLGRRAMTVGGYQERKGVAAETFLTYDLKKMKYEPSITAIYAYFSGNRGGADEYTAWDPMYENQKLGDIANLLFPQSNAHVAGVSLSAKPIDDIVLKGEYYAYWWDKVYGEGQVIDNAYDTASNLIMRHKKFAGTELDLTATYDYTEDVQFGLMYGLFLPGNAFNKDSNHNAAAEVIGSMKVSF